MDDNQQYSELRERIAKLGMTQSGLARRMQELGDPREHKNILRSIQRMISGDARFSGEMRALIGLMEGSGTGPSSRRNGAHPRHVAMWRFQMDGRYDEDFVLWSEEQADLLRRMVAGEQVNDLIDWKNIIEEIASLGKSERTALATHVATILVHLLKLDTLCAEDLRPQWYETILHARRNLERLLKENPGLKASLAAVCSDELTSAKSTLKFILEKYGDVSQLKLGVLDYSVDQVTGPWLPEDKE